MLSPAMAAETASVDAPAADDGDMALARAAASGDGRAFEALYRRHSRRVYAVVWRLAGGQAARAEDLVQESFIRAWQALPAFRFESAFTTWLHRLAVNTALMDLRGLSGNEDRETDELRKIQAALGLIDQQEYGSCQVCGKPIPRARLEELPTAFRCVDCTP